MTVKGAHRLLAEKKLGDAVLLTLHYTGIHAISGNKLPYKCKYKAISYISNGKTRKKVFLTKLNMPFTCEDCKQKKSKNCNIKK
jgi:hypothetical protein